MQSLFVLGHGVVQGWNSFSANSYQTDICVSPFLSVPTGAQVIDSHWIRRRSLSAYRANCEPVFVNA